MFLVLPTGKTLQAAQTVSDRWILFKLVPIGTNLNWLMQYFQTIASAVSDKLKMAETVSDKLKMGRTFHFKTLRLFQIN